MPIPERSELKDEHMANKRNLKSTYIPSPSRFHRVCDKHKRRRIPPELLSVLAMPALQPAITLPRVRWMERPEIAEDASAS
jgi:hypothetical protein